MKTGYGVVVRLTQAEVDAGKANQISGSRIEIVDASGTPTGVVYESGAAGVAPTQAVTAENINTVIATAGGAGWEKTQITTASYQLKPLASGASRDFHIESGGSLATLVVADWPKPTSPQVDVFKIRNFSGSAKTFQVSVGAGQFAGIVTADDDSATPAATSYSIRNDGMVVVSIDSDGWVQVVPSAEVSQAEFDAHGHPTYLPLWTANTAVKVDEIRRASTSAGSVVLGDTMVSLSTRTTGAAFDAAEAGNWAMTIQSPVTVSAKESTSNKVTAFSSPTDTQYPSAKLVSDQLALKHPMLTVSTIDANSTALQDNAIYVSNNTANATNVPDLGWAWKLENYKMGAWRIQVYHLAGTDGEGVWFRSIEGNFTTNNWWRYESPANKVTAWTTTTDHVRYPTEKLVKDSLDAKQATLVSSTTIKTVNGASVLGTGNLAVAADLPGGIATTAYDDGLSAGNATVDRATVTGQTILKYLTPGTTSFKVPSNVTSIRWLGVAGGGSGGNNHAGGGGAGEYHHDTAFAVTPGQTIAITVGAGGAAQIINSQAGNDGIGTVFGTITLNGGGGGGGRDLGLAGRGGGSGGGGAGGTATEATAGTSVKTGSGLGNAGGSGFTTGGLTGGGGGGSASAGASGTTAVSGTGGSGTISDITGANVNYAAGGTGGAFAGGGSVAGATQDGAGAGSNSANGGNATANRGSGGGGGGPGYGDGGAGGSGIVVVRFATQTRSYQALQSYADNAGAIAGGKLVGEFYKKTADGSVQQVQ